MSSAILDLQWLSNAVMRNLGMLLWLLGMLSAGGMGPITWLRLGMMVMGWDAIDKGIGIYVLESKHGVRWMKIRMMPCSAFPSNPGYDDKDSTLFISLVIFYLETRSIYY